ncbi:unnamed protein product [Adineta steineri]|uniref:Uncharacterized protein n=1 Tax=Adineta steineri TaxID=433720 RepID=A0A818XJW4_9BILA|nr:unnamed protein product [Adineta steineri]CAF1469117.1 unnamed protein product [Adineta steineri]CAF3740167.1 unnamed protein product [Adineta steineri]CAF3863899.1 unnamed protein product [Adineta steineri]
MLNKASINDDGDHNHHQQQQQHVVIGDILLHSDSKTAIIQVVIHSLKTSSSLTSDKPIIQRQSANSSGINNSQAIVSCDLKNTPPIKVTEEQVKSRSSKKLVRIQKAGMALVKDFKSKVIHTNQSEPKTTNTKNTNSDTEQTYF